MLDFRIENQIAMICLNSPEKRNALSLELIQKLKSIFDELYLSDEIRAVFLMGRGEHFCAGADLEWMRSSKDKSFAQNKESAKELFDMFEAMRQVPVPIVTRVQGGSYGGALGLLSLSDVVIAEESSSFCFSEVKLGLVPAVISSFVMAKLQKSFARAWMLTGERFDASQAYHAGLVHFVGSASQCDDYLSLVRKNLLKAGPRALRACKELVSFVEDPLKSKGFFKSWRVKLLTQIFKKEIREICSQVIAERRVSPEGQEGLASFFEKRPPSWAMSEKKQDS